MVQTLTAKADARGRVAIPQRIRDAMKISPGDTLFIDYDEEQNVLRYAKGENPFDVLLEHALAKCRAGRTRSIQEFAAEHGIELDGE